MSKRKVDRVKTVELWGRTYKIEPTLRREDDEWGRVKPSQGVIRIDPRLSVRDQKRTVLHELIHVALWDMGSERWVDESLVGLIEFTVSCVMRENPELIQWLMGGDDE